MSTLRELKGRIGSVASSEKITGAMKMISSAKMHKAEQGLSRLVPFRNQLQSIMGNLMQADAEYTSELTDVRDVKTVTIVTLGSDEGLCGAYNINIFKGVLHRINELREANPSLKVTVVPIGKKLEKAATSALKVDGVEVAHTSAGPKSGIDQIRELVDKMKADFVGGQTDRVEVVSMKYLSAGKQRLTVQQLLPVSPEAFGNADGPTNRPYLFEPDANRIYNTILPLYVLSMTQEVFGQNAASEQAARVMAMQSANDNAQKLHESLQLEYNKLRQQGITTELLDILGGQVEK